MSKTVLSVSEFVTLHNIITSALHKHKANAERASMERSGDGFYIITDKIKANRLLEEDLEYQYLLRLRNKLDEISFEIEVASVEGENGR